MPRAVFLSPIDGKPGKPGQVYYPLVQKSVPQPTPTGSQLLIKLTAASLNHRDLFLRQHLYPGLSFDSPLGSDGVGIVVGTGPGVRNPSQWQGKRVILNPASGWLEDPDGPENPSGFQALGANKLEPRGTLQDYVLADESEVEEAPAHLTDAEASALPLAGLTAWRALVTKAGEKNSGSGATVLITGIGGGVALFILSFAVARGANVYVTSSSDEKIKKAIELGAKGGVNYKEKDWEKSLLSQLPEGKKTFDAIIDGAGGDIVEKGVKILKPGGVISVYGMTTGPKMPYTVLAFLKNIEVRGTSMGSRKEFKEMVDFVKEKQIRPVISRVLQADLSNIAALDSLFEDMKAGRQVGKLVIEFGAENGEAKL